MKPKSLRSNYSGQMIFLFHKKAPRSCAVFHHTDYIHISIDQICGSIRLIHHKNNNNKNQANSSNNKLVESRTRVERVAATAKYVMGNAFVLMDPLRYFQPHHHHHRLWDSFLCTAPVLSIFGSSQVLKLFIKSHK